MKRLFFIALILTLLAVPAPAAAPDAPLSSDVRISQVFGGGGGSGYYLYDYVELFNAGASPVVLTGWSLQYGSAAGAFAGSSGNLFVFPAGATIQPGHHLLIQTGPAGSSGVPLPVAPDLSTPTTDFFMSQSSGKVALTNVALALGCGATTTPCALPDQRIVDLVAYGTANNAEGGRPAGGAALTNQQAAVRKAQGCQDTDVNRDDFDIVSRPAPRNSASPAFICPANSPITAKCPANLITRAGRAVAVAVSAADSDGTVVGATINGRGVAGLALDDVVPAAGQGGDLTANLNVGATTAVGAYTVVLTFANTDAPTSQTATCTVPVTVGDGVCPAATITPIGQIQGKAATSPLVNAVVTIQGAVVGDFQGAASFKGFYVQDAGDDDPLTSDGIFVYAPGAIDVVVGDAVQVTGKATEYMSVTELSGVTAVSLCGDAPAIAATRVALPEAVNGDLERYEGMLVAFPQTLTAAQNYFLGRYGQITLSAGGRMFNPINGNGLGDTVDLDARRMIVLDDGLLAENPAPIPYIGADDTHRAGDTITGLTGVVDYGPINATAPYVYDYRIQPIAAVVFARANRRPAAPAPVGGNVKIASANVMNYFTTIDPNRGAAGYVCGPAHDQECRGADSAAELTRQRTKLLAELLAINADVIGMTEIENTDDAAIADLAQGLNDALGAGTYAYVVAPAPGSDAIRVALLYKPGIVAPVGPAINYQTRDPVYGAALFDRPPLAQTFSLNANGELFTTVVNHFKSKSNCPTTAGDPDLDYGQGCWNAKRVAQANALLGFVAALQTTDPDVLVIGDLNAYGQEDPINALTAAGLTDEIAAHVPAATRYTYVFDGLAGYLDQALATRTMDLQVAGVTIWHNNTDEPSVIDYNLEFKPQDLYTPTAYRASDHDPVVVGLDLAPTTDRPAHQPAGANSGVRPAPTASIGDRVWYDDNGNGVQDAGEAGPRNVTVALLTSAGGAVFAMVATDADGNYQFSNLEAGSYFVKVTDQHGVLAGLTLTSGSQSKPSLFGPITVSYGDVYGDADFGYTFAMAPGHGLIGDRVWLDANHNGIQDAGEGGLAGVQVCASPLGYGARACAITNADGVYRLSAPKGIYLAAVVGAPAGLAPTTAEFFMPVVVASGGRILRVDFGYAMP